MLKKLLAALGALALVAGVVALVAGPVSAHTPTITPTCSTLTVTLTNYQPEDKVTDPNHVTVWTDGTKVADQAFTGSFSGSYPFKGAAASHTYQVKVSAWDDPTGSKGYSVDTGAATVGNCETTVTPADVTTNNAYCVGTTVGGGGYAIPTTTGVQYQKLVNNAWTRIPAGPYSLAIGEKVSIRAVAQAGYKLSGKVEWDNLSITGPAPTSCSQVTPVVPTATSIVGCGTYGTVTVPANTAAVTYTVKGSGNQGDYTVTATVHSPYTLAADAKTSWTFHLGKFTPCVTPVCIPNSAVSYTYLPASNSGVITVKDIANSTGVLCNPFYVTATSWKYTKNAAWPQVRDVVDKLPQITKPGVYTYAAAVTCGQGDIYASFTSQPDPTPTLTAPGVPFAEHFLHQMGFTGPTPTYVTQGSSCYSTVTTAAAVTPKYATCTGPGTSSDNGYTVTQTTGVTYQLKTGNTWKDITVYGLHDLGAGASNVEIQAIAEPHYVLTGTTDWKFTFTAAKDCLLQTQAGDPKFVDGVCDATHPGTAFFGTYTVIVTDHVKYYATVNGGPSVLLTQGVDNKANPGDVVVITPVADPGYVITNVIAAELLHHTFAIPGDCLTKATPVKPAFVSQVCEVTGGDGLSGASLSVAPLSTASLGEGSLSTASLVSAKLTAAAVVPAALPTANPVDILHPASITIPTTTGVVYYINDVKADAGPHILDPGTYKVSAMAATNYVLQGYTGPWSITLTSAEPCQQLIDHPLVTPAATQVQMTCFAGGSYTLSNNLSDSAALTWTVNGTVVGEGKYVVNTPSKVVVHVSANGPAYGLDPDSQTDWTFNFARPTTCDLKTLALTGSTPVGWIALGYALLVSGLALLAVRFARRRGEQA